MERVDMKINHTQYSGEAVTCKKHIGMHSTHCSICLEGCCGYREGLLHEANEEIRKLRESKPKRTVSEERLSYFLQIWIGSKDRVNEEWTYTQLAKAILAEINEGDA